MPAVEAIDEAGLMGFERRCIGVPGLLQIE